MDANDREQSGCSSGSFRDHVRRTGTESCRSGRGKRNRAFRLDVKHARATGLSRKTTRAVTTSTERRSPPKASTRHSWTVCNAGAPHWRSIIRCLINMHGTVESITVSSEVSKFGKLGTEKKYNSMHLSQRIELFLCVLSLTACSGSDRTQDEYRRIGPTIVQASGYFTMLLHAQPSTVVNGAAYLNELRLRSPQEYTQLEAYTIEVHRWRTSTDSNFIVFVWDSERLILIDCSESPKIDAWYCERVVMRGDRYVLPPCGGPYEFRDP